MKQRGSALVALVAIVGLIAVGAVVLHSPWGPHIMAYLHGEGGMHGGVHGVHPTGVSAEIVGESGGDPVVNALAREGVARIGRRWDEDAFAETVALYTAVHRDIEWPGLLEPETIAYGPDPRQTFVLYRPEQGFSEPGPVFLFLHGNGLGSIDRVAPGSDGLIFSHLGKLGAWAGGLGISMNFRFGFDDTVTNVDQALERAAEDIRLVIEWINTNISPYGGDPGTIVVMANSEGATATAGYLFNEDWQMESGHGVAAAILSSGAFGSQVPQIESLLIDYEGEPVPLALWVGEYDVEEVSGGVADLHEMLCRKYSGCPFYEQIAGHNHVSHIMSLGTADTDVMNRFIRFYHTVR